MNHVELLAPAGSFSALKAAIASGANAVYLGGNSFGARAFAKNFEPDELIEAIQFAHLYNVKIFVTVNTLVYQEELPQALEFIQFLYNHDVDAVIVQDLGLLRVIRREFPLLEIHCSTQMTLHNKEGIQLLESLGVKRVVLARENTIEEIQAICASTSLDVEVFVHGALCVCYSGQCLMSSLIGGRSGNRGACAQPCRKTYDLYKNQELIDKNHYLISPKDLNTINHLDELITAGVQSLKIEGRMKSPEYVAIVVSNYRKALDNQPLFSNDHKELAQIFNREFTEGFGFHAKGNAFINLTKNNNTGVFIGYVMSSTDHRVNVKLSESLTLKDGIYFENTDQGIMISKIRKNQVEVTEAKAGDLITLDVQKSIPAKTRVFKITDHLLEQKAQTIASQLSIIPLNMEIELYVGKKMKLTLKTEDGHPISHEIDMLVEKALKQSLDDSRIQAQLSKLGETPYYLNNLEIKRDSDSFVLIGHLNQLRRETLDVFMKASQNFHHRKEVNKTYSFEIKTEKVTNPICLSVYCRTLEQVEAAKKSGIPRIYVDESLHEAITDKADLYLALDRIQNHPRSFDGYKGWLISDLGVLQIAKSRNIERIVNVNLNVTNQETIEFMKEQGVDVITLSYEMSEKNYRQFSMPSTLEVIVYGYQEAMVSKHCVFAENCKKQCKQGTYFMQDSRKEKFPMFMDEQCHMHILNSKCLVLSEEVLKLIHWGYSKFRIQLTNESFEESLKILKSYHELVHERKIEDVEQLKIENQFTKGYFNKSIF